MENILAGIAASIIGMAIGWYLGKAIDKEDKS